MKFYGFHWLSRHGLWVTYSTNTVNVRIFGGNVFIFFFSFQYFGDFFDKTVIKNAHAGYEMITANARARKIIVNYLYIQRYHNIYMSYSKQLDSLHVDLHLCHPPQLTSPRAAPWEDAKKYKITNKKQRVILSRLRIDLSHPFCLTRGFCAKKRCV